MKKRITCICLVLAVALALLSPAALAAGDGTEVPWALFASAPWGNASAWALEELGAANEAGLIPDILKGADLTKPISREEFCELALLLYEKATGGSPAPVSPNPFTDTNNPAVLKAYALGITDGTSETTFSPGVLINREQCATMLFRAIRAIHPKGDYSVAGVPDFPDQRNISSFAAEGTKFMWKLSIIKGDESGNFMPKAVTAAESAAGYGMATREAAILMNVRTYGKMDEIRRGTAPQAPSGSLVGTWQTGSLTGHDFNAITGEFRFNAGLGQAYYFYSDGTFSSLIVAGYGNSVSFTGKYTVNGDRLTFSGQTGKISSDYGQTWTQGNSPPDSTRYFSIGEDELGLYLLMGLEDAELPLDTETNAVRYFFME